MTRRSPSILAHVLKKGRGIGNAVMIEHTLFSLPFAVCAFLLESAGRPSLHTVFWILVAIFGARNGANALNRLVDEQIDAENPRTADRDLQAGRVRRIDLVVFTVFCVALLLVAAWKLNPLCLALVPVAALLIFGYSFTKRFTWACHYWLGLTCSAAVMGSFLALAGRFELRFFALTAAVMFWVAGFDIIYALQDLEHDRARGLHSIPARFGAAGALAFVAASFTAVLILLAVNGIIYALNGWYYAGVGAAGIILAAEFLIAWTGELQLIPFASYRLNQLLSPLFMVFTLAAIYLPGGIHV